MLKLIELLDFCQCNQGYRLTPVEFDKDDDCNYHAEFVAAAASLRGCNYGLPLTDKLQVNMLVTSTRKFVLFGS
jgi:hypothetical protein